MSKKLDNKLLKELILEAIEEIRTGGQGFTSRVKDKNPGLDLYRDPAVFPAMSAMQRLKKALQQASLKGAENMTPEEIEELDNMLAVVTKTAADAMAKGIQYETKEETLEESHTKEHEEELKTIVGELEKASQMHASQAERIQKILDETDDDELKEENVTETYGQHEFLDACKKM